MRYIHTYYKRNVGMLFKKINPKMPDWMCVRGAIYLAKKVRHNTVSLREAKIICAKLSSITHHL